MKKTIFFIIVVLFLIPLQSMATHAAGMDISYECLSQGSTSDTYRVTVKFYRDCGGIAAPPSMPLNYSSSCGSGSTTLSQVGGGLNINPTCLTFCNGGSTLGIEEYTYQAVITLSHCSNWVLSVCENARNDAINTIQNPGAQELCVQATLNNDGYCNNSPTFSQYPTPFICAANYYCYNNGAIEIDGDDLVYTLITPLNTGNGGTVNYIAPFSATNPVGGGSTFDPVTGNLCVTPPNAISGVLALRVDEYRNGVLIGSIIRDIQINVFPCAGGVGPTLSGINSSSEVDITTPTSYTYDLICTNGTQNINFDVSTINSSTLSGSQISVNVTTNPWPNEVSWEIVDPTNGTILATGGAPFTGDVCIPTANLGSLQFVMYDSWGDGWNGSNYTLSGNTTLTGQTTGTLATGSFQTNTFSVTGGTACTSGNVTMTWNNGIPGGNFTVLNNNTSNPIGTFNWTPTAGDTAGSPYFFTVSVQDDACPVPQNFSFQYQVNVTGEGIPTFTQVGPYCAGATIPALPTTSNNGISGTWSPVIDNTTTTTYTFTPSTNQCGTTTTMTIEIVPNISPTFTQVGPYCAGATIPALPTTSNNGISGTWSPVIDNTTTTTYTFTPSTGQCGTTTTMTIVIDPNIPPTFTQVGPYCEGATIPALPTTSNNGISGTWSPVIDNTTTTTYTFTPSTGQCGTTTTMTIVIDPNIPPTFTQVGPYCEGATIPALPTISNNSFIGTWSPAIDNTVSTAYTFTPSTGQCATTATMTVNIFPSVSISLTSTDETCEGLNDGTANVLLGSSSTGGTVSLLSYCASHPCPDFISQAATIIEEVQLVGDNYNIDNNTAGTDDYYEDYTNNTGLPGEYADVTEGNTYTVNITCDDVSPSPGTYAPAVINVYIDFNIDGDFLDAGEDLGEITIPWGTWIAGTTYPFSFTVPTTGVYGPTRMRVVCMSNSSWSTPSMGPCEAPPAGIWGEPYFGATEDYSVVLNSPLTGATYLWSNGETTSNISALTPGTYSVTVTDFNSCSSTQSTVIAAGSVNITPLFAPDGPYCEGAAISPLPTTSNNGISGTWSPAIDNTSTTTYTFTPNSTGVCATTTSMTIVINTIPTVNLTASPNPACVGDNITLTANASSGNSYRFQYDTGTGWTDLTTPAWSSVNPQTYPNVLGPTSFRVMVQQSSCTPSAWSNIEVIDPVLLTADPTISTNVLCHGGATGTATIVNPQGGTGTYTYLWSDGQTTQTATNLSAGTYDCVITDANGCSFTSSSVTITEPSALSASSVVTNTSCFGGNDGTATITAGGGTSPYTYLWSDGQTTLTAINLTAGSYSCQITDDNGCTYIESVTISEPVDFTYAVTTTNPLCDGLTGQINVSATGGSGWYNYTIEINDPILGWIPYATTTNSTGAIAYVNSAYTFNVHGGVFRLVVLDDTGCQGIMPGVITITQPSPITSSISGTNVLCHGGSSGSATVTAGGGTSPYTYLWSDGQTTATATGLSAGTYDCVITDANGCPFTSSSVTITEPSPITSSISSINVLCHGGASGSATVTAGGGTSAYTYLWSDGQTTQTATNLSAGTYDCVITDANGCSFTSSSVTITEPSALSASSVVTNTSCFGGNDGTATITAGGGTSPYTYLWSDGQTTLTAINLTAGSYSCQITDDNGCTYIESVTISEPVDFTYAVTTTNPLCDGLTGQINVSATGGSGWYNYTIEINDPILGWIPYATTTNSTGAIAYVNSAYTFNVHGGVFRLVVLDDTGCQGIMPGVITITQPSPITSSISGTNVLCHGGSSGSATVTAGGGTSPYTYLWSDGQTTATATGLSAGTYDCVITDANGCPFTSSSVTITEPSPITSSISSINVLCHGGASGSATVTAGGGTSAYTYLWSDGQTTQTATNLSAGTYDCVITDANGCSFTSSSVTITEPSPLTSSISSVNVLCNGDATGSATVTAGGGTSPYTYLWSDGQTTLTAISLTAGSYSCQITDDNGCVFTDNVTITEPLFPLDLPLSLQLITNALCDGGTNGTAQVLATGGTSPYVYAWEDITNPGVVFSTSPTVAFLSAGNYVCTVTDFNGCVFSDNITITQPSPLTSSISGTNVLCHGGASGSATVTAGGGTSPYTFLWSDGQTTQTATNLSAGTYDCVITDANGCSFTSISVTITEPSAISSSISGTNVSGCYGNTNGSATVTAVGGTSPYTYLWSDGQTTATATGLSAGNYDCVITDANGCPFTSSSVTITEPSPITSSISSINVLCHGDASGSATVTAGGGTSTYTYLWSDGQTTATATGLSSGTYDCVITDANGCSFTSSSVTITEPSPLTSSISSVNVLCNGDATGSATVTAGGGTSPYTYLWSDGQTTLTAISLTAGTYDCVITDANGCSFTSSSVTITEPSTITVLETITNVSCFGGSNGVAIVSASGGVSPYLYNWLGMNSSALPAGIHSYIVTDANLCSYTNTVTVSEPSTPLSSSFSSTNVLCYGDASGSATVTVGGGTSPYAYLWSNGQITAAATSLTAGSYSCQITDDNGCVSTDNVIISQPSPISIISITQLPILCHGDATGTAIIISTGGTPFLGPNPYLYDWGALTNGLLPAGTHTFIVSDANSCSLSSTITISEPPPITSSISGTNVLCHGGSSGSATVTAGGGTSPYTYLWSDGQTTATATGLSAGTYDCVITDANGCPFTSSSVTITEPSPITSSISGTNVLCHGGASGSAIVTAGGGLVHIHIYGQMVKLLKRLLIYLQVLMIV